MKGEENNSELPLRKCCVWVCMCVCQWQMEYRYCFVSCFCTEKPFFRQYEYMAFPSLVDFGRLTYLKAVCYFKVFTARARMT